MPKTNEKNLRKLNRLLQAMDEDSLTRAEFTDQFTKVLNFLKSLKEKNQEAISEARESLHKLSNELNNKLSGDNSKSVTTIKDEFTKIVNKALREQEDGLNFLRDKVRGLTNGIDGKDADEVKIIKSVLDKIKLPEYKETVLDTPVQIAEKLELLEDENRLDIKAIRGLEEIIKELKNRPTGRGGGARKEVYSKFEDLSSLCDGATKTFTMPKDCIAVTGVFGTQFPGGGFRPITDWKFEGNTLTLTSEVGAPQTGQTLWAMVQCNFFG